MKIGKWALHYQVPVTENFDVFRIAFAEANSLLYAPEYDQMLQKLWNTVCSVYSVLQQNNMQRWLPVDFYFHISAMSTVWFFSLHLKHPALSDIDMICNRYVMPLKRGPVKNKPNCISVSAYLTGVAPADEQLLKQIFSTNDVEENEVTFYLDK